MAEQNYKVLKVEIKDFKKVEHVVLDVQGRSLFLIGDNKLGKTSIMDAIWTTLSNLRVPNQPIREGAEKAEILIVIGKDGHEYTIQKTFEADGTVKLEITSPEGFKTSKVSALTNIVGNISFDVLKFVNGSRSADGRRDQLKTVRGFISEEINDKLDEMDEHIKQINDTRKAINVNITNLKQKIKGVTFSEKQYEDYAEPSDASKLMQELQKINSDNNSIDIAVRAQENLKNSIKLKDDEHADFERQIEAIRIKMKDNRSAREKLQTDYDNKEEELKQYTNPTIELEKKIADSFAHNQIYNEIKAHKKQVKELDDLNKQYKDLEVQREKTEEAKVKLLKDQKLPIEGLTLGEDCLFINGIPLDDTQQSTSEIMDIAVRLAIAQDPVLKIVRIDGAESFGSEMYEAVKSYVKAKGFQGFYEEVERGTKEIKFEYSE